MKDEALVDDAYVFVKSRGHCSRAELVRFIQGRGHTLSVAINIVNLLVASDVLILAYVAND